jgi:hypothetical protein
MGKKTDSTDFEHFMETPANMHGREQILMHRLFLDLKTAAARSGYYLNTYFDDVDHDGFDVIFDDQDYIKKVQVKSVHKDAATGNWKIHKRMLRPSLQWVEKLGFESSPHGHGSEGGVILIEFEDINDELRASYYYTDVFVLLMFHCDVMQRQHKSSREAVDNALKEWKKGSGRELISIPRAAFLQARNPASLLALMGLHSLASPAWKHLVFALASEIHGDGSVPMPTHMDVRKLGIQLLGNIRGLCAEPEIVEGKTLTTVE